MLEFRLGTPWDNPFPETVLSYLDSWLMPILPSRFYSCYASSKKPRAPISVGVLAPTGLPPHPVAPYQGLPHTTVLYCCTDCVSSPHPLPQPLLSPSPC